MTSRTDPARVVSSEQLEYEGLLHVLPESPCPYLPERMARTEAYHVERLNPAAYEWLMARGFRRSGYVVYRPRCRECAACIPLRVDVARFVPSKSMRRVLRRNADVSVVARPPAPSREKHGLFVRYLDHQHDGGMSRDYDGFCDFLYRSPTRSLEMCYYLGRRLMGVSILDVVPDGLSSVYMYFEPQFADRSPGTFSILYEIDWCKRRQRPWYYLGYWVDGSVTMSYKARFGPAEILGSDHAWRPMPQ